MKLSNSPSPRLLTPIRAAVLALMTSLPACSGNSTPDTSACTVPSDPSELNEQVISSLLSDRCVRTREGRITTLRSEIDARETELRNLESAQREAEAMRTNLTRIRTCLRNPSAPECTR